MQGQGEFAHRERKGMVAFLDDMLEAVGGSQQIDGSLAAVIPAHRQSELDTVVLDFAKPFIVTSGFEAAGLKGTKLQGMLEFNQKPFFKQAKVDPSKGGTGMGAAETQE